MNKTKTDRRQTPVDNQLDPEVLAFRQQFDDCCPLDQLVREGARKMLQEAINAEVEAFIDVHQGRRDENGRLEKGSGGLGKRVRRLFGGMGKFAGAAFWSYR